MGKLRLLYHNFEMLRFLEVGGYARIPLARRQICLDFFSRKADVLGLLLQKSGYAVSFSAERQI